jgi:hypothetical protein
VRGRLDRAAEGVGFAIFGASLATAGRCPLAVQNGVQKVKKGAGVLDRGGWRCPVWGGRFFLDGQFGQGKTVGLKGVLLAVQLVQLES